MAPARHVAAKNSFGLAVNWYHAAGAGGAHAPGSVYGGQDMKKKLTLFLSVTALAVAASLSSPATSQAYRCPTGVPYCQKASQCLAYCGTPEFSYCFNGCCSCTG